MLGLSRFIDRLNEAVGRAVAWLVLAAVLISAGNALVRKLSNNSSNAFLEIQWYLFAAVFLLAAGRTLLTQDHVRIDVLSSRFSTRTQSWIEVFGLVAFLFPLVAVVITLSLPLVTRAFVSGEVSSNAGGLVRWPVLALMPLGFALLGLQGLSELIKRVGFLLGKLPAPTRAGRGNNTPGATRQRTGSAAGFPMTELLAANMAPVMFASLVVFLLVGFPVAFSLGACGLFYALVGIELGLMPASLMQALPLRIFGIMQNDTLLAIPFFTFMGLILERSGMAEDLLDTIGQLFGPVRGGLAYAVIFVGAMLAATTGVVAASVISMGLISLPIMLRYGYDRQLATGVIAASGTLAQIIPPSLVLIVLADQLGQSVGDLYQGALVPSLMLTGLYAAYVAVISVVRPRWVPALPPEARTWGAPAAGSGVEPSRLAQARLLWRVAGVLVPPLALIFLVLGTIFLGIATPTEGGAMGAVGALIIALANRRLSLPLMRQAMDSTVRLSCFVMFILIGSTVFSLAFQAVDGPKWVEHLLVSLPGGALGFLIVVNLLIFALAFFLDFFELAFIVVPLLAPVATVLGIDLVWFGVLLAVNMQTSFMHPPFGFALFYLRSVAPDTAYTDVVTGRKIAPVSIGQIYRGAIPFVLIQLAMVALIIAFPGVVSRHQDAAAGADADSVLLQTTADTDAADAALSSASEPEAGEDDPMKAMQQAIEADRLLNPK